MHGAGLDVPGLAGPEPLELATEEQDEATVASVLSVLSMDYLIAGDLPAAQPLA